ASRRSALVSSVRCPCERRDVAEDRRDVAIAVQEDGDDDEREREAGGGRLRARPQAPREREHRRDEQRPPEQMVQERGALEEPSVLLVPEEGKSRDREGGGHRQPPGRALQL